MEPLRSLIQGMTDDECKAWMRFAKNKQQLMNYWSQVYPEITPFNIGEVMFVIKYGESPYCDNGNHRKFKQFPKGYSVACGESVCGCFHSMRSDIAKTAMSSMSAEQKSALVKQREQIMLERYGVTNAAYLPDHQEKCRQTMTAHYGQPTSKGIKEIADRKIHTTRARYGVDHYSQSDEYKQKTAETNLKKYGVENHITAESVITKRLQTMTERYGVDNYFKSPDYQKKIIDNRKATYGYENIGQRFLSKETYEILQDPETLKSYISGVSYEAAAKKLNTSAYTVTAYVVKYGLEQFISKGSGSVPQDEIIEWLRRDGIEVVRNDRTILAPKEIDIFLPEYNLGIEYNGIYYHTEFSGNRDSTYHVSKMRECARKQIDLMQICSTVYKKNPDLVKSIIMTRLGKSLTIYARKCKIVELSHSEASAFLLENHIQSHTTTGLVRYGLIYNDELVQVMTFGKQRVGLGAKAKGGHWELIRMASKKFTTVVGGTSRLVKHFVKKYDPLQIISYTDLRYFTGKSLAKCGFKKVGESEPGYWYTDYRRIYHRFNFTKQSLTRRGYDPSLTESQIMRSIGYDVLWDCGQAKWVFEKEK